MRRPLQFLTLAAALTWSSGCASTATDYGCFPPDGDLAKAERTFLGILTGGRADDPAQVRARYCLGLIYSLPEGGLYDWGKAETALEWVIRFDPASAQAQVAAQLLELRADRDRLSRDLEGQQARVEFLHGEVAKIQEEGNLTANELADRQAQVEELAEEIGRLQREIEDVGLQLLAKEDDLERIKKIDLETPP